MTQREKLNQAARKFADENTEPLRPKDSLYGHMHATIYDAFHQGYKYKESELIEVVALLPCAMEEATHLIPNNEGCMMAYKQQKISL